MGKIIEKGGLMNINREIAEIAEKVMGWKLFESVHGEELNEWRAPYENAKGMIGRFVYKATDWNPKENIEHAMEVDAEMFKQGWHAEYQHLSNGWTAQLWHPKKLAVGANSNGLPEAIYLAALEAVK